MHIEFRGCFILCDHCQVSFMDLLSGLQISLPSFTSLYHLVYYSYDPGHCYRTNKSTAFQLKLRTECLWRLKSMLQGQFIITLRNVQFSLDNWEKLFKAKTIWTTTLHCAAEDKCLLITSRNYHILHLWLT